MVDVSQLPNFNAFTSGQQTGLPAAPASFPSTMWGVPMPAVRVNPQPGLSVVQPPAPRAAPVVAPPVSPALPGAFGQARSVGPASPTSVVAPTPAQAVVPAPVVPTVQAAPASPTAPAAREPITVLRGSHVSQEGGPENTMSLQQARVLLGAMRPRISPVEAAQYQLYDNNVGMLHSGLAQAQAAYEASQKTQADYAKYVASATGIRNEFQKSMVQIGLTQFNNLNALQGMNHPAGAIDPTQ